MGKRIMEMPELNMEVIVTGIMATIITYNSSKANLRTMGKPLNLFDEEDAGQFFEEDLHIHPTCYSILYNMHN